MECDLNLFLIILVKRRQLTFALTLYSCTVSNAIMIATQYTCTSYPMFPCFMQRVSVNQEHLHRVIEKRLRSQGILMRRPIAIKLGFYFFVFLSLFFLWGCRPKLYCFYFHNPLNINQNQINPSMQMFPSEFVIPKEKKTIWPPHLVHWISTWTRKENYHKNPSAFISEILPF